MFGLFKKKRPYENESAIVSANNIACDFSDLIASNGIEPGLIYDVSVLPHAKDLIEKSCKLWVSVCPDASQRQSWKVVLPILAQFQEGMGSTPLGLDIAALAGQSLSPQEMAKRIMSMKDHPPSFVQGSKLRSVLCSLG